MSRRTIILTLLALILLGTTLGPVEGQGPAIPLGSSPSLLAWVTAGESAGDATSLVDQIVSNESNDVYDYWITYSRGSYHISYGGIVGGIRG